MKGMLLFPLLLLSSTMLCDTLIFELDGAKQCFFEKVIDGGNANMEYKVMSSSNGLLAIDCILENEDGLNLYSTSRKEQGSYQWNTLTQTNITYQLCFHNDFSKALKTVYFVFSAGDDKPCEKINNMKETCDVIIDDLTAVITYQADTMLQEVQGDMFVESLGWKVKLWTIIQLVIMACMMASQVYVVRSLFSERRTSISRTAT